MLPLTTRELADLVEGELHGRPDVCIDDVASLEDAGPQHVAFVESAAALRQQPTLSAGALLLPVSLLAQARSIAPDTQLITVQDPMAALITAMLHFRPPAATQQVGVSPAAHVSSTACLQDDTQVFPGATVGDDVQCGKGCVIYPGACIGAGCRLGDHVTIYPNAVLYDGVTIGNHVIIHAAAVIGSDGFGYRFAQGRFQKIPHTGTVVIEDDVEIGAGTTIDRGMIGATVIGAGTKLDNQVMIAHNCRIGKHNAFASQVGLAGSTTSGDYVRCGGQAGIADHSHLGTGCSIGAKAGLFGTVPDGAEYHGYPAGPAKEQYRIVMTLQKLPEMRKQLRTLEDEVRQLRAQLAQTTAAIREDGDDRPRIPAAA
jgi:UDP-3-O-[3-hydroxymyristoyl] glucosamine N-acyltransferase